LHKRCDDFFFVQIQRVRVLPKETTSKEAAGKAIEPVLFHRLQIVLANLGMSRNLLQLQTAAQSFATEGIADRIHNGLSQAALRP
jgi:hypothetical protein